MSSYDKASKGTGPQNADYAKGGETLGRTRDFMKESDGKDQKGFGKIPDEGYKDPDIANNDYASKKLPSDLPACREKKQLKTVKPRQ